jgi:hypothetical protein
MAVSHSETHAVKIAAIAALTDTKLKSYPPARNGRMTIAMQARFAEASAKVLKRFTMFYTHSGRAHPSVV